MWLVRLTIKKPMNQIDPKWFEEHEARNGEFREKGIILANGAFADGSGGSILYNCSKEELDTYLSRDPLVVHDVVDYETKEWNVTFSPKILV